MGRELARSGFRLVAFGDWRSVRARTPALQPARTPALHPGATLLPGLGSEGERMRRPVVTALSVIGGASPLPGLGDVPRAAGVL